MEGKEENHDSGTVAVGGRGNFSGSAVAVPTVVGGGGIFGGSTAAAPPVVSGEGIFGGSTAAPPSPAAPGAATPGSDELKKKRGRPRKYGPDGKLAATLSPMPISASIPLAGDFSGWKHSQGKPVTSVKKRQKLDFGTPGERVALSFGANFTPHVIKVGSGEDVNMKIISFSQQGSRAICILTANGTISNVTLHQPNSCGGTLTYEGRFEILSLSGAFMPNNIGGAKGRSGGMSVSLAGPDGRVLGGGLAGMLVAAGPVQVVLGSFLPDNQQTQQQKPKKSKFENVPTISPPPITAATPIFTESTQRIYGNKSNISFTPTNPTHESHNFDTENNGSLHGSKSKEVKPSQFEVSY